MYILLSGQSYLGSFQAFSSADKVRIREFLVLAKPSEVPGLKYALSSIDRIKLSSRILSGVDEPKK